MYLIDENSPAKHKLDIYEKGSESSQPDPFAKI